MSGEISCKDISESLAEKLQSVAKDNVISFCLLVCGGGRFAIIKD